jgi:ribosomal protein S18 acetylase RimI-like enzyme
MATITLRAATADDSTFCYDIHRRSMRDVVDRIWGWNEQDQKAFHVRAYDPAGTQLVLVDGIEAGVLIVDRRPDVLFLSRIEIDPPAQNRGVGTSLIRSLQAEAAERGVPLVLEVFLANRRAHALYQRLGFRETRRSGPKREMRWSPA